MKRAAAVALSLLLGVVLAGGHLALLQGVAWATMLLNRAGQGSFTAAVAATFDGKHPCALCQALERDGQADSPAKPAPELVAKKMKAECLMPPTWRGPSAPPLVARLRADRVLSVVADEAAPPVPPPKRS